MKDRLLFDSLDLKGFVKNVPETAEEYDKLAGRQNACVEDALNKTLYHGVLGAFRDDVMDRLIEITKIAAKTKDHPDGKKDDKGVVIQVIAEKPADYVARVAAQLGKPISDFQNVADEVCNGIDGNKDYPGLDFKDFLLERVRTPKGPNKRDLETAKEFRAQGPDKFAVTLKKLAKIVKPASPYDAATITDEAVAAEVKKYRDILEAEQKERMAGLKV